MKIGDRIRIKFEYNYNSCNWGYIADFDVEEIHGELFLYCLLDENLRFFADKKPFGFNPIHWEKISKDTKPIFINCTGNEKWCSDNATIKDIINNNNERMIL